MLLSSEESNVLRILAKLRIPYEEEAEGEQQRIQTCVIWFLHILLLSKSSHSLSLHRQFPPLYLASERPSWLRTILFDLALAPQPSVQLLRLDLSSVIA
jgi:hypothetical protein